MKRIVLIFLSLFSVMSMITDEYFFFDGQKALAQRMCYELETVYVDGNLPDDPDRDFDDADAFWAEGVVGNNSDSASDSSEDSSNSQETEDTSSDMSSSSSSDSSTGPFCKGISQSEILQALFKSSEKIRQTGSTCSAAVLQKLLAETNDKLYREIVMALYKTGKYEDWDLELSDCYKWLRVTDVTDVNNPTAKFDPVDLILQGAFINRLNAFAEYDPTLDNGKNLLGNFVGMEPWWRMEWMICNVMEYDMVKIDNPTFEILCTQNYKENFIVGLVYYNDENYNFQGDVFHQHYAQITGTDTSTIQYWSWASRHSASKESSDGIQKLYVIKRKK